MILHALTLFLVWAVILPYQTAKDIWHAVRDNVSTASILTTMLRRQRQERRSVRQSVDGTCETCRRP